MFRSRWLRNLLQTNRSRKDRRRAAARSHKPVRLMLESLEDRLTPSAPAQTAGSYTDLVKAVTADTAANTNYVIQITNSFTFNSGGQVNISRLGAGSTLTIQGQNGTNHTLTGNGNRLFNIAASQNVTFEDLTLTGGGSVSFGGAIQDMGGNVTLSKVVVEGNSVSGSFVYGGGIYVLGEGGSLSINDSTIQSNTALGTGSDGNFAQGGGLAVNCLDGTCTVVINDSVISNNRAQGGQGANGATAGAAGGKGGEADGGGVFVTGNGWNVTLRGDTFTGNRAIGGNGGNGAAGSSATTANTGGGNGGGGGSGGNGVGGAGDFIASASSGEATGTLTILNDSANPSIMIDNSAQAGSGGRGGAGGASTGTAKNSDGGAGGSSFNAVGGAISVANAETGNISVSIGNATFYGNNVGGGSGGSGGAAGTGGSGAAGTAGTNALAGSAYGGGIASDGNLTLVNSTVAKNSVTAGFNGGGGTKGTAAAGGGIYDNSNSSSTVILENNTITQNTIFGGPSTPSAGVAVADGNPTLRNNLIQGNQGIGSSALDLEVSPLITTPLSNASNNFIGTMSPNAVSTSTNIVGNSQVQLGNVVGVDANGKPIGGPIYYPLLSGTASIGAGSTSVLDTIASVEGTTSANAVDEIGNPRSSNGSINLGAVQTVAPINSYALVLTGNPGSQSVYAGSSVSFTATASGNPMPTVQWQASSDAGKTWSNISGASSTTLTLDNVSLDMSGNEYQAVFTNSSGSVTSAAATLTVNTAPPPPPPSSPPAPPVLNVPPLLAFFDSLLGGTETVNANGTETITDSLFGIPVLVSTFDSQGNLMSVTLFGFPMPNWIWFV